jgi:hypothetical protein
MSVTKDRSEIVKKIQDYFMMTINEAENEYDVWIVKNDRKTGDRQNKPPVTFGWHSNNTTIKVKLTDSIDTKVLISGVKNIRFLTRIKYLLSVLFDLSKQTEIDFVAPKLKVIEDNSPNVIQDSELRDMDDDMDSDDEEFMKQLQELEKEDKQKPRVDAEPEPKQKGPRKIQKYVLNKLREADPTLFDYEVVKDKKRKDFPSICGWTDTRQPMVISKEEKDDIDKRFPGAYDDFLQAGSTSELANKNYYICPKIWCTTSRVAMNYEQFKKNGNKCPIPDEEVVLFNKYWSKDEKTALTAAHHIGLLNDDIHPAGFCLPCCFKKPMKQKINRGCRIGDESDKAKEPVDDLEDDMGNEKYIKDGSYFPLQNNRFGLLPEGLQDILGTGHCGSRYNGAGLMENGKTCYLRHGINQTGTSFLNCIEEMLNNGVDITSTVINTLGVDAFIALENGKLMKMFIDNSLNIQNDTDYTSFIEWMNTSTVAKPYMERFGLTDIEKKPRSDPNLMRDFLIYGSYKNFIEYMKSSTTIKNHILLLDLIHTDVVNINTSNKHFIIFDVDPVTNEAKIICPYHKNVAEVLNVNTQKICFIVKVNNLYEPICQLTVGAGLINTLYEFNFHEMNPKMKMLVKKYINGCGRSNKDVVVNGENLATHFEAKGYDIKAFVVQYDFKISGLVLQNDLYIPFLYEFNFDYLSKRNFMYYDALVNVECKLSLDEIDNIYEIARKFTKNDLYQIHTVLYDANEDLLALKLKNDILIPLNVASSNVLLRNLENDLYIFTDVFDEDDRLKIIGQDKAATDAYSRFYKDAKNRLTTDNTLRQQVDFLLSDVNPLPDSFKRDKLMSLLATDKRSMRYAFKFTTELLNKYIRESKITNGFTSIDSELLLEQGEMHTNVFKTIIENRRNPFKMIIEHIENQELNFMDINDIYNIIYTNSLIPDSSSFKDLPINQRTQLRSFKVLENAKYDPSWLYAHFVNLSKFIYPNRFINIETLKSIIRKRIIDDYDTSEIDIFLSNEPFRGKKEKPSLKRCLEVFDSVDYYPSLYEMLIMCSVVAVNTVIIARKTRKYPDGVYVTNQPYPYFVFLKETYDRVSKHFYYEMIVKNKQTYLLKRSQIPSAFLKYISKKTMEYLIDV